MPAPFGALRASALAAVDAVMAEDVRLLFLSGGRADILRPPATIKGVLRVGTGGAAAPSGDRDWKSRVAAGEAELRVSTAAYGSAPMLRAGDKVKAVERAGSPLFEVLRVDDRRAGRLLFALGEA